MRRYGKRILCFIFFIIVGFGFGMAEDNKGWGLQENSVKAQAAEADENGFVIEDNVAVSTVNEPGVERFIEDDGVSEKLEKFRVDSSIYQGKKNRVLTGYVGKSRHVKIPEGVIAIGDKAFWNNNHLISVEIPESVTYIGWEAFTGCSNLKNVKISSGIKYLGYGIFQCCDNLLEIQVDKNNTDYVSIDGVLFNKDMTELIQYPCGKRIEQYKIPESVTKIWNEAFSAFFLTSIEIPASVMDLGTWEDFYNCTSLTEIQIDKSNQVYTSVDGILFNKAMTRILRYPREKQGKEYEIPDGIISIEYAAFSFCDNLAAIAIPDSVVNIGRNDTNQKSVFDKENKNLRIYCHKDSTAHTYAIENGYNYVLVEGDIGEAMHKDLELMKVKIKKRKIVLKKGQKSKIKLLSKHDNISYESKNTFIASINSKGTVTGKKKGKTVITVTANGMTAKVKVTVKSSSANEILLNKNMKLSKKSISLKKGEKLEIQKASGISGKMTYKSSNKKIASVSVKGVVKAKKRGKTVILIKKGGKTVKLKITVKR